MKTKRTIIVLALLIPALCSLGAQERIEKMPILSLGSCVTSRSRF